MKEWEDFRVELASPHGVFYPGQLVQGQVIIRIAEPKKARSVVVHVSGKAKTHWTVSERYVDHHHDSHHNHHHDSRIGHGTHSNHAGQTRYRTVHYSAEVAYMDFEMVVWHSDDNKLPAGTHTFPFSFPLPANCAPSFEGTVGFVRYKCTAKIDRPWKFDKSIMQMFTVLPYFDLNSVPHAATPAVRELTKNLGVLFFKHGRLSASVSIPKSGFVPGESILVAADVSNTSSREVRRIEIALVENATYTAHRQANTWTMNDPCVYTLNHHGGTERQVKTRTVAEVKDDFCVPANSSGRYQKAMVIPAIVPSFNICPIVQVDYFLQIKICAKGLMGNDICGTIPILVGTVPVRVPVHSPAAAPAYPAAGGGLYPSVPAAAPSAPAPEGQFLAPPQPSAPPADIPPPTYEESVFGSGTVPEREDDKSIGFAPKYAYYANN
ncbi:Protein ARRD-7 [Aphelenchoides avenae]|nr:Protein ARRD-7 [Aphelenchus avenae]